MPTLTIDGQRVEVPAGATILEAAGKLGIAIPTLCHLPPLPPNTSCMVCVVQVAGKAALQPACAAPAAEGLEVRTNTPAVLDARRTALELLLSDHTGDCQAPCQVACPARMDIPRMVRQIAAGQFADAVATVKADIALPALLGRICPAPCEKACRRGKLDQPLAICKLKRFVADWDLAAERTYLPTCPPASGHRVAVVGAGPAGLAAAYHLRRAGHAAVVYERRDQLGGAIRYELAPEQLDRAVLDAEIQVIARMGTEFRTGRAIDTPAALNALIDEFDAVILAMGPVDGAGEALGLATGEKGLAADPRTGATERESVFAAGSAIRPSRLAVAAEQSGKSAAASAGQYLTGQPITGAARAFSVHVGPMGEEELAAIAAEGSDRPRQQPTGAQEAFTDPEARAEAGRCLHCDCRAADHCPLRDHSAAAGASPTAFRGQRRPFRQIRQPGGVIYEPGKCISCGLCVQIAAEAGETLGLAFIGRGFDVRVAAPLSASLDEALTAAAADCVAACPTGALAWR